MLSCSVSITLALLVVFDTFFPNYAFHMTVDAIYGLVLLLFAQ